MISFDPKKMHRSKSYSVRTHLALTLAIENGLSQSSLSPKNPRTDGVLATSEPAIKTCPSQSKFGPKNRIVPDYVGLWLSDLNQVGSKKAMLAKNRCSPNEGTWELGVETGFSPAELNPNRRCFKPCRPRTYPSQTRLP